MAFKNTTLAAALAVIAIPALAGDTTISIEDAYARSGIKSGAAFFVITNSGAEPDRLLSAASDLAPRVELHTHLEDENGVMRMREIEGGIEVPAGGVHSLVRGGDHVMFMGLEAPFEDGARVPVTLTFERAGDITLEIPVDNDRQGGHGHGQGNHGS